MSCISTTEMVKLTTLQYSAASRDRFRDTIPGIPRILMWISLEIKGELGREKEREKKGKQENYAVNGLFIRLNKV